MREEQRGSRYHVCIPHANWRISPGPGFCHGYMLLALQEDLSAAMALRHEFGTMIDAQTDTSALVMIQPSGLYLHGEDMSLE